MKRKNGRRRAYYAELMEQHLAQRDGEHRLHLEGPGSPSLAAWFVGPQAENHIVFSELIQHAIDVNRDDRRTLYADDPAYVTAERKDGNYDSSVTQMKREYQALLDQLRGCVPFYSYRYQAHMNWDLTIPGMAGYFAAMLYNQNNVALEASPVTSQLEREVGDDLCKMLGFDIADNAAVRSWGHVTCDGSVANLEAMWAARNLKYYSLSIKAALIQEPALAAARNMHVSLCSGAQGILVDQDAWTLMNLAVDDVLRFPQEIQSICNMDADEFSDILDPYLLQTMGFDRFISEYGGGLSSPVVMGPATKHYSWPKNAALTGIGKANFIDVVVDGHARMNLSDLDSKLSVSLQMKQPVAMVVAVLGSTEESAVDPLAEVVALRETYRKRGLDFVIHVDAAWGGYFASILREPDAAFVTCDPENMNLQTTPILSLSPYVTRQYEAIPQADSVTIDPHKAGYIPYAAGGLCYRNSCMRNLIAFLAPEVYHGSGVDANMGVFGVEGSKPGAAAAGIYLSHRIVRPDRSGYGKILGQALFNSKRFYSAVITMAAEDDDFIVVPVQQIPAEQDQQSPAAIKQQMEMIKTRIVDRQNNELVQDEEAMDLLKQLGSDQIIITYGLNFKRNGVLNQDAGLANEFMHKVFEKLSLQPAAENMPDLIITTSEFDPVDYGSAFVETYMKRLGLKTTACPTMNFLSSTTMCPWLTATADGNFIPTLIQAFRAAVADVMKMF